MALQTKQGLGGVALQTKQGLGGVALQTKGGGVADKGGWRCRQRGVALQTKGGGVADINLKSEVVLI